MKSMFLLGVSLLSFAANAVESPGVDSRCFISVNNKTKMRLMTLSMHGWAGGYVQYGIKNEKIPVVLTKLSSETLIRGRPPLVDSEWVEVVDGNINGKYHFTYQGAIFDKVEYINKKGVKFQFKQADHDYDDCFSNK